MSAHHLERVAVPTVVVVAGSFLATSIRALLLLGQHPGAEVEEAPLVSAAWQCAMIGFLAVGAVVARRRPRNPVGWVLLALPLLIWSSTALAGTAQLRTLEGIPLGRPLVVLDLASTAVGPSLLLVGALFFLVTFPENQPTRTGRVLLRVVVPLATAWAVLRAVVPMRLDGSRIRNPYALVDAAGAADLARIGENLSLVLVVAGVDMALRYRRATGQERLQYRWVVRSLLLVPLSVVVASAGETFLSDRASQATDLLAVWMIAFGIAAGIGVAVLRYRLYDIDRVVSRTLAYTLVTAILVALYAAAVLVLGGATRAVSGSSSDLVVALSTLSVAAAFQPVRRRVQSVVDRRFNRARYDAQRTSDRFSQRLRDQVDLGELRDDLTATVREAVAPATLSVWLPAEGAS